MPLIVSVMGFSRDELATLVDRVGEREEVALIELNVSCPNVETGLVMGADPAETARAVERVRPLTDRPLIVKLTPNANEPAAVARAAEDAGADAISLINTLKGMALDPRTARPWLGGTTGGVSGAAVRAIALEQVAVGGVDGQRAGHRDGRDRLRAPRGGLPGRRARPASPSGPRASAIRPPDDASRPSSRRCARPEVAFWACRTPSGSD